MSASFHETKALQTATGLASGTTGDKATLGIPYKCVVKQVAVKWEGADANATAAIIAFDKRPTAGSDTGRGVADVGQIKKVASLNEQGKVTYQRPATKITLQPGEEVVVEVTTAQGAALAFQAWLHVEFWPEDPGNLTNMKKTL